MNRTELLHFPLITMTFAQEPPEDTAVKDQRSRTLIHDPWRMQAGKLTRLPITRARTGTKHSLGTLASSSSKAFYCAPQDETGSVSVMRVDC